MKSRNILRAVALGLTGLLLGSTMVACGTPAAPDYLVIRYDKRVNGGGLSFKECVQPSHKAGTTWNDQNFALPTSLRTWNITLPGQGGDSSTPVQTGTKRVPVPGGKPGETQPGADVLIYTRTQFYLNTDCGAANKNGISTDKNSPIVRFWENTGRRYGVSKNDENGFDNGAWVTMLQNTLVTAQMAAIRNGSRNYDGDDLDGNVNGVWSQLEARMSGAFTNELQASVGGGDYFCGPQYRRDPVTGQPVEVTWTEPDPTDPSGQKTIEKSGTCPPVRISITDVVFADPKVTEAKAKVTAAQKNAQAAAIDTDSKVSTANKLKGAGAEGARVQEQQTQLQIEQEKTKQVQACAAAGARCVVVTGGNGAGVNVNTGE